MGYSTNMTTSEDQFECLNETARDFSFAYPLYFIIFYFIQSICAHDKALLYLFDFSVHKHSGIYNKKKIKDHIWILGGKITCDPPIRVEQLSLLFLKYLSIEVAHKLCQISLPAKETSDLWLYSWRVNFNTSTDSFLNARIM